MIIGISTGALARGDWQQAVAIAVRHSVCALELSALRMNEFESLANAAVTFPIDQFHYVSFHAPSTFPKEAETSVVSLLLPLVERGIPIVAHPDCIYTPKTWEVLGSALMIENMDKRKPCGRTAEELEPVFEKLPDARWCFDVGHARQVDGTMSHAIFMLRKFRERLAEIHLSDVDAASRHCMLNESALSAFRMVMDATIVDRIPIILETPATEESLDAEVRRATDFCLSLLETNRPLCVAA